MDQIAVDQPRCKARPARVQAPGSAFLALMAGLWGAFVTLLVASPATLDDAYGWMRELPPVWELLMWLLTLPWTVAYLVYEPGWEHWVRVLVVAVILTVHLGICAPRVPRTRASV